MKTAAFSKRSYAFLTDVIAVGLAGYLAGFHDAGLVALWVLVETVLTSRWGGRTIGKNMFGIRVMNGDESPIGIPKSLLRALAKLFSTVFFGLGFLTALLDKGSKTWHDKMAGTLVAE